jgi:hypothetical protein
VDNCASDPDLNKDRLHMKVGMLMQASYENGI